MLYNNPTSNGVYPGLSQGYHPRASSGRRKFSLLCWQIPFRFSYSGVNLLIKLTIIDFDHNLHTPTVENTPFPREILQIVSPLFSLESLQTKNSPG